MRYLLNIDACFKAALGPIFVLFGIAYAYIGYYTHSLAQQYQPQGNYEIGAALVACGFAFIALWLAFGRNRDQAT